MAELLEVEPPPPTTTTTHTYIYTPSLPVISIPPSPPCHQHDEMLTSSLSLSLLQAGCRPWPELLEVDHRAARQHGGELQRHGAAATACMALTNPHLRRPGKNKALLCSMRPAMEALVAQLRSPNEDLCQGAASVLRNLSWRADLASKRTLREVGAVTTLMEAAMGVKKETTLKSILSALWNLSSHCSENKAEICAVRGALEFLVSLLTFKSSGKTTAHRGETAAGFCGTSPARWPCARSTGGVLRRKGCLQLLLAQLRSTSLTIVKQRLRHALEPLCPLQRGPGAPARDGRRGHAPQPRALQAPHDRHGQQRRLAEPAVLLVLFLLFQLCCC